VKSCTEYYDYVVRTFFEVCQVDGLLELTIGVSIFPEYRSRGIVRRLYQAVIDLGRVLAKGVVAVCTVEKA
jgi:ribosomal protein S18 acetylase RimI-like enzyme